MTIGEVEYWIVGGDLADPVGTRRFIAHVDLGEQVGLVRVGAEHIALRTNSYRAYRLGWDGSLSRINDASGGAIDANSPRPVGATTVFEHWGARSQILASHSGGPPTNLVPPSEPGAEPSVYATDGRTLAWLSGVNRTGSGPFYFERVELWASPFADAEAAIRPIRLTETRRAVIHGALWAGYGHAAVVDDDPAVLRFFRLSDGHEVELRSPSDVLGWAEVAYIGPREILAGAGPSRTSQTHIQFIDYTTLEPGP